jgi:hypothetical protein
VPIPANQNVTADYPIVTLKHAPFTTPGVIVAESFGGELWASFPATSVTAYSL